MKIALLYVLTDQVSQFFPNTAKVTLLLGTTLTAKAWAPQKFCFK